MQTKIQDNYILICVSSAGFKLSELLKINIPKIYIYAEDEIIENNLGIRINSEEAISSLFKKIKKYKNILLIGDAGSKHFYDITRNIYSIFKEKEVRALLLWPFLFEGETKNYIANESAKYLNKICKTIYIKYKADDNIGTKITFEEYISNRNSIFMESFFNLIS